MQWLQDQNQRNLDNLNILRCESSRYFKNKKKKYPKARIDDLETTSKVKKHQKIVLEYQ